MNIHIQGVIKRRYRYHYEYRYGTIKSPASLNSPSLLNLEAIESTKMESSFARPIATPSTQFQLQLRNLPISKFVALEMEVSQFMADSMEEGRRNLHP